MEEIEKLIRERIAQGHMMQLATVNGDQPWCCTVYYVFDKDLNLYWFSLPTRRHSEEINLHDKVAAAIPIKYTIGEKIVGLSVEGKASIIKDPAAILHIVTEYAQKFKRDERWVEDVVAKRTVHQLYKLSPDSIVIIDEENFAPNESRIEMKLR